MNRSVQAFMNDHWAGYQVRWVPATPEYILAHLQEEWRQCAVTGDPNEPASQPPTFVTTVHEWRQELDLVWWSPLGHALNKEWNTKFSQRQWFGVLVPAREKTLRHVCNLLATAAQRPVFPRRKLLGCDGAAAGVFLAVRSILVQAGAPPPLRPSTPLEPYLRNWPKVFCEQIARLAPGGLPLCFENRFMERCTALSLALGCLLLLLSAFAAEPWLVIGGVALFAFGWFGGLFGGSWFPGRLKLENTSTFRGLTERIVEQHRRFESCRAGV